MASQALTPADGTALVAQPAPAAPARFGALAPLQGFLKQPAVKRSLPLLAALALLGIAALAWSMLASPPQKILFSGLADADKAAVSEALTQGGIANTVDPSTGTLTVAEDDYYRARMLMAQQDLPKAAPGGYAILDQLPMGVSRAVEGERLRQARETELARSIEEIDSVADARVHLAMPEASVFVREAAAPSASVIVRLNAGRSLTEAQVRSIVNLVASSVPGMQPDAVTIVDGAGQLLTRRAGDPAAGASDERIEFQARVEDKYRAQLTQLLTPLVGAGNFTAEVQADVNLDQSELARESFQPQGTVRAEQESWTANGQGDPSGMGIPGTLANQPPTATQVRADGGAVTPTAPGAEGAAQAAAGGRTSSQMSRNYEVGKEVSVTRAAPGGVRRVSVAVVLRDPEGAKPRSAQELQQLTNLVRAAVGFDPARNDQVTVISRPFQGAAAAEENAAPWYEAGWVPLVARNATALVIALLILFLGIRPLVKSMTRKKDPAAMTVGANESIRLEDGTVVPAAAFAGGERPPVSIEMLDSARGYDDKVSLVRDFTRDNPARAALAVRDMIQNAQPTGAR
ncbi:flagellar M-ring protein FliF [Sphingomonas jejuensis]|uniref:Flagellar M-ring protein n=1 Tax=Sphingomonas jejuensis TaxID=904715 RepID=A0ABX0XPU1_9SPHN|nr:flagellar basal-body MS-ring/collar protein FliF [Sphingomonas jejuensis]NJC34726.1 flagellar M-ring protein FliF [Sphingomonas jejuensis]